MRKIIKSAFVSLDGVTEDPGSWAIFDPDAGQEAAQELQALGGMLMGRGTYEYFADVIPKQTGPYADAINAIRKYVFSSTLERADWNNSTIIRDDVVTAVNDVKQQDGGDLMIYGHGRLSKPCSSTTSSTKSGLDSPGVGLCGRGWRQREEASAGAPRHGPLGERRGRAHLPAGLQQSLNPPRRRARSARSANKNDLLSRAFRLCGQPGARRPGGHLEGA